MLIEQYEEISAVLRHIRFEGGKMMNHLRARTLVRFSLVVLFLPLLLVNACKPMSDEEILESILSFHRG